MFRPAAAQPHSAMDVGDLLDYRWYFGVPLLPRDNLAGSHSSSSSKEQTRKDGAEMQATPPPYTTGDRQQRTTSSKQPSKLLHRSISGPSTSSRQPNEASRSKKGGCRRDKDSHTTHPGRFNRAVSCTGSQLSHQPLQPPVTRAISSQDVAPSLAAPYTGLLLPPWALSSTSPNQACLQDFPALICPQLHIPLHHHHHHPDSITSYSHHMLAPFGGPCVSPMAVAGVPLAGASSSGGAPTPLGHCVMEGPGGSQTAQQHPLAALQLLPSHACLSPRGAGALSPTSPTTTPPELLGPIARAAAQGLGVSRSGSSTSFVPPSTASVHAPSTASLHGGAAVAAVAVAPSAAPAPVAAVAMTMTSSDQQQQAVPAVSASSLLPQPQPQQGQCKDAGGVAGFTGGAVEEAVEGATASAASSPSAAAPAGPPTPTPAPPSGAAPLPLTPPLLPATPSGASPSQPASPTALLLADIQGPGFVHTPASSHCQQDDSCCSSHASVTMHLRTSHRSSKGCMGEAAPAPQATETPSAALAAASAPTGPDASNLQPATAATSATAMTSSSSQPVPPARRRPGPAGHHPHPHHHMFCMDSLERAFLTGADTPPAEQQALMLAVPTATAAAGSADASSQHDEPDLARRGTPFRGGVHTRRKALLVHLRQQQGRGEGGGSGGASRGSAAGGGGGSSGLPCVPRALRPGGGEVLVAGEAGGRRERRPRADLAPAASVSQ